MKRPRPEDCQRLCGAVLKRVVAHGDDHHRLADGTVLRLIWRPVRCCFGGSGGQELLLSCPRCGTPRRCLHRPRGCGWCCWRCTPLSTAAHRRSGARRGREKPVSWRLAQLEEEQQQAVDLLALEQWPPPPLLWSLADLRRVPRRPDAPRLSEIRVEALLLRIDALQSLKLGALMPLLQLESPAGLETLVHRARAMEEATRWAVRRPARDGRTTRSSTPRSTSPTGARPADPLPRSRSALYGVSPP